MKKGFNIGVLRTLIASFAPNRFGHIIITEDTGAGRIIISDVTGGD